ncbi:amidase family protein [Parapusillimonas granuli]|uniref:Amidase n=1 Tax=Parapusillimonas granuli TaxID=380911 RepID=A0A853G3N7_9BURK|nr:amidase family protein [Parapusillimonas granuli]MBB5215875.1 aspartyl-tRNA(Asn)/glutamyl-tRNA(Gln) amidotransferase subunit A [Parapusillimonas granuli]NYT50827.1 amidase [Parapusillimonas granuli]
MLHQASFQSLRERYRRKELSPVDVARSALDHAERVNPRLNAFALIDRDAALAAARASEQRWHCGRPAGPLDGMPLAVKEFAAVRGWPTRRGSLVSSPQPAEQSTPFVQRLEDAGAVLLGKTRAPEFNWKGVTDSPGFGITRNPWDLSLTPGGSSGGCSAAVAAGIVRVSLGSDAGGSIRIPAAFTGMLGLKPTFGRVPVAPLPSAFSNVVHTGPIASDIHDLKEVYGVVCGPSAADWTSSLPVPAVAGDSTRPPASLRIGLLASKRWDDSVPAVKKGMARMLAVLAQAGLSPREVDYDVAAASAAAAGFYRVGCAAAVRNVDPSLHAQLDPGLLAFSQDAAAMTLPEYLLLCQQRDMHANQLCALFDQVDVLMLPTLPICAFEAGRNTPAGWPGDDWMTWNPYTPAFNAAQAPALSFPVWPDGHGGLPVGVQFVAPKYCEDRLLALAGLLQAELPIRVADLD